MKMMKQNEDLVMRLQCWLNTTWWWS